MPKVASAIRSRCVAATVGVTLLALGCAPAAPSHGSLVSSAGAALATLYAAEPLRPVLAIIAYAPMLGVVALVNRLEQLTQPNQAPTVVPQGHT